jgi:hypothetical protein
LPQSARDRLRRALGEAETCALRNSGVRRLSEILDPDGTLTRSAPSGRISAALARFETTAWPRIRRGLRQPRTELEAVMAEILLCDCPRSARRLRDVL